MAGDLSTNVLELTAKIVSAHVVKNSVPADALPGLINVVYRSLATAGVVQDKPLELTPAVPIHKSVFPDYIVCLENGKKLKMLKRHLQSNYNMSPDQYRQKWGLPSSYPMVAPNYASQRSMLAKQIGLGQTVEGRGRIPSKEKALEPALPAKSGTRGRAPLAGGSKR